MAETYRATFQTRRQASVDITVPDTAEPLSHIAGEIARELDLMRFEVQVGFEGGHIRHLGDDGPGIAFSLALLDTKD